ncbi:hypothetical protein B0H15DRAFT_816951 [Mycena belliarum]|uniref:FAD-binding domain-containing protein n=1 Tax=Mycena belliarum TaxID=1033014 RepID=A0AAD6UJ36_9AGAR|nr:hypothetical protein B0H15DRAFT_816951 [Mycena belliae]
MPGQLIINPRRAGVSLRIVVVGGGLAGTAAAFALQRAGHSVTVLERTDGTVRSHGGIRSPPNMTRILNHWGLAPALAKVAVKCHEFKFHQADGELLGLVQLHEDFLRDLMADFIFIQHGDLHELLLGLATREGVEFRYDAAVTAVDSGNVSVTLACGERLHADLVVGADGPASLVRTEVVGEELGGVRDGHMSVTFAIPTALMRDDADLAPLTQDGNWWVWLGPSMMFHGTLVAGGKEFSVIIGMQGVPPEMLAQYAESWDATYPLEQFGIDFSVFDIRVQKLVELAKRGTPTVHVRRPLLESSVCDRARIAIIGEAAHPLVPAGQHNAGLMIEDAETLGGLFARIQSRAQIPRILAAYEEIRQPRANYAQAWELRKRAMMTSPPGPEQKKRDAGLRSMMAYNDWAQMDETGFRAMWGDEMEMFSYFSTEVVDDWWTKWGALLARHTDPDAQSSGKLEVPLSPTVQVSVSNGRRSAYVY